MAEYVPKRIIIDNKVRDSLLAHNVLDSLPGVPTEFVDDPSAITDMIREDDDPLRVGKRTLLLTENRGRFLKPCPGTKEYICCGYQILNFATNCNIECSYCILQTYLNNPVITVYANLDEMFRQLEDVLDQNPGSFYRIGTGEFTDSLAFDHLLGFTSLVVPYFAGKKNAVLELKTKTDNIANLLDLEDTGNTVVAWSLNAEEIARKEELLAPSIDDRIDAAYKCQEAGYMLGFHFDPLIYYLGWEDGYQRILERLFAKIDPLRISWISMGCLRFPPGLKSMIQKRFPKSKIVYEEFVSGLDGKQRYFQPIRIEMYSRMLEWMRGYNSNLLVYLCMESREVWKKVFKDDKIMSSEDLAALLETKNGYKGKDHQA